MPTEPLTSARQRAWAWAPFALLVLGCLGPLWWSALLPGQDLAAHLAYARIVRDVGDPALPFAQQYRLTDSTNPYFTTYHLLVGLGGAMSLVAAARGLCTAYVLALFAAVFFLARQAHPDEPRDRPPAAVYLLAPLVWNPTAAMGFLVFQLTLPLIVAGAGAVLWMKVRPRAAVGALAALCTAAGSLHVFAAASLTLVAAAIALFTRERRHALGAAAVLAASAATLGIWRVAGELGVTDTPIAWSDGLRAAIGFEAITHAFGIAWGTPPLKLTYACYTIFGPWTAGAQVLTALGVAGVVVWHRRRGPALTARERALLKAAAAFGALACLTPWGIHLPSEFTFIDLRLMTVAGLLLVAFLPPGAFAAGRGRLAVVGFALGCCAILQVKFAGFAGQARPVLGLLGQVDRGERLAFLSFDGTIPGWGRLFRLSQTLPLHHTVVNGGITPQLWGRYTRHLPIEFQPGREPVAPPVWQPWEVESSQLAGADVVLLQAPRRDGPQRSAQGFDRATTLLHARFEEVACDGAWCLHRKKR